VFSAVFTNELYQDFDVTKKAFIFSVWTIDLAHIMKEYDVKHKLCTITAGVDKSYSKQVSSDEVYHIV